MYQKRSEDKYYTLRNHTEQKTVTEKMPAKFPLFLGSLSLSLSLSVSNPRFIHSLHTYTQETREVLGD